MSQHVVVVGAGLVGAAAALALAKHHQVTLIEPLEPAVQKGALGVDLRNVAISPASRNLLNRLRARPLTSTIQPICSKPTSWASKATLPVPHCSQTTILW